MRRPLAVLVGLAASLVPAATVAGAGGEPVTMAVRVPAVAASSVSFPVRVSVTSDPGALDGAGPLRVRVKAARECGASFDSTLGTALLDKPLGASREVAGSARTHRFGTFTVCAFLEQQGDARLYAFDDSASFAVTHACTTYSRRAAATRRGLRKVKRALRHAHGAHRAELSRKATRLRAKLRRANAGRRRACSARGR